VLAREVQSAQAAGDERAEGGDFAAGGFALKTGEHDDVAFIEHLRFVRIRVPNGEGFDGRLESVALSEVVGLQAECPQRVPEIAPAVMALFRGYPWPGNVRQLASVLRTAAVMAAGEASITEEHLSDDFLEDARRAAAVAEASVVSPAPVADASAASVVSRDIPVTVSTSPAASEAARTLGEAEIDMIRAAVEAAGGNISEASKRLGISRNTIYRKLRWNQEA